MVNTTKPEVTNDEIVDLGTLPPTTDPKAVRAFVRKSQSVSVAHKRADRAVITRAAYATWYEEHVFHNLYQSSQKDNAYTNESWAALFGIPTKSSTTAWRTLGRVLMDLDLGTGEYAGQAHNHPCFIRLRSTNGYTNPDVKKVIDSDKASAATIIAAMDKREAAKKGRGGQPNDGTKSKDKDKDDKGTPVVRCLAAVKVLDEDSKQVTLDEWADIEKALAHIIERENHNRSKEAATVRKPAVKKAAAKKATPRKRTAKKAAAAAA